MRGAGTRRWRYFIAVIAAAAGLTLAGAVSPMHAVAAGSSISGVVEDTSGTPQENVTVNALDPATDSTAGSTTTAHDGTFTVAVNSGTYNVQFIPPSSSDLQSYLATNVPTDSTPLTVILKSAVVVQVQGTLSDAQGNVYGSNQNGQVTFTSPLNKPGSTVNTNTTGSYSASVVADSNFTANASAFAPGIADHMNFSGLPVGTLDTSQTYNLVMPTAQLTVSVRDANGNPIPGGGKLQWSFSSITPLPGLPGTSANVQSEGNATALDANDNITIPVPEGITLTSPEVILNNGLTIPFQAPVMNGNQSVTVTAPASIQVQGTLSDAQGNVYGSNQNGQVTFTSPLNKPGSTVNTNTTGSYSASVVADSNFTANASAFAPGIADHMNFSGLPVGTLDTSQTYNLVMPTAQLTVSVRDANGNPIPGGGKLQWSFSSITPLPGLPGTSANVQSEGNATALDANDNITIPVPEGITLTSPEVILNNGLTIPFQLHPVTGIRHAYIIFNTSTGSIVVDDQPPTVTGNPDRAPNANGWYNAPVTITWTSVDPAPSSGLPTTPAATTVSAEGANQTVTSAQSCDPAGNCAVGKVTELNLDLTPPAVSLTGVTDGTVYNNGTTPSPTCTTSDSLSGVATNATLSVTHSGTSYTATCSGAADEAGNTAAPVTASYQVIPTGWTTASLADSGGNPIAGAAVVFRSSSGSVTNATTGSDGIAGVALTPGTYSVTMYYATGYGTKTITVTANGPNAVSFATVAVTAQVNDPSSADLAAASVAHAGNTGTFGAKTAVDGSGQVVFQVLPGTNSFTAWDAYGYQTQTVTVTGATTVTFSTVAVTITVLKNGSPLTTALVAHAGNTGSFGPKTAVDGNGQVVVQVLPGTSTFTAWDGTAYQSETLTVTAATSTSISVQ
jgi:hypothetical protein